MATMGRSELMDRFDAVLPRVNPADEARQIVLVMARICRAASAAAFFERGGVLRWLAGDPLSDDVVRAINGAWRTQRPRILTGMAFTDPAAPTRESPVRSWLMWVRRPEDAGLDAVYFAGPDLRPPDACSSRLTRLAALLGRLH